MMAFDGMGALIQMEGILSASDADLADLISRSAGQLLSRGACAAQPLDVVERVIFGFLHRGLHVNDEKCLTDLIVALPDFVDVMKNVYTVEYPSMALNELLPELWQIAPRVSQSVSDPLSEAIASVLLSVPAEERAGQLDELDRLISSSRKEARMVAAGVVSFLARSESDRRLSGHAQALAKDAFGAVRARVPAIIAELLGHAFDAMLCSIFVLFVTDSATAARRACADAFYSFAKAVPDDARAVSVIAPFRRLLQDGTRSVSGAALRTLGPVITTLASSTPPDFLRSFTGALVHNESEIQLATAFCLSAVVLSTGILTPEMARGMLVLADATDWRARRAVAFSLHRFAELVPGDILVKLIRRLTSDISAVAIGILTTMDQLGRSCDEAAKELLRSLLMRRFEPQKWRMRLLVSRQLRYCSEWCDRATLFRVASELVRDPVAAVRKDAASSFALLMAAGDWPAIERLSLDESHFIRAMACTIIAQLSVGLRAQLNAVLERLATDPVPAVREAADELRDPRGDRDEPWDELREGLEELRDLAQFQRECADELCESADIASYPPDIDIECMRAYELD